MFLLRLTSRGAGLFAILLLPTACDEPAESLPGSGTHDAAALLDAATDAREAATDAAMNEVDGAPPIARASDAGEEVPTLDAGSWRDRPAGPAALGREVCSHSFPSDPQYPVQLGHIAVDSRGNIAQVGELPTWTRVLGTAVYEPPGIASKTLVNFLDSACNPTASKLLVPQLGPQGEAGWRPTYAASFDRDDQLVVVNASRHGEGVFHGYTWVLDVAYQTKLALDGRVLSEAKLEGAPGAAGALAVSLSPTGSILVTNYWSTFKAGSFDAQQLPGAMNVLAWYGAEGAFQRGAQLGNADHIVKLAAALTGTGELWTLMYGETQPQAFFDTMIGPEATLAKVDAQGHVTWQKKLADSAADRIMSQAPDDSLVVFSPKAQAPSDPTTAVLSRYQGDGSVRWEVPVFDYALPNDVSSGDSLSLLSTHTKHTALVVSLSNAITIGNATVDKANGPVLVELDDVGSVQWVAPLEQSPIAIRATGDGAIVVLEQAADLASYTVRKFAR